MVFFHEIYLVGMLTADYVEWLVSLVVLRAVLVAKVRVGLGEGGGLAVRVAGEDFGEGVAHLELAVSDTAHVGLLGG